MSDPIKVDLGLRIIGAVVVVLGIAIIVTRVWLTFAVRQHGIGGIINKLIGIATVVWLVIVIVGLLKVVFG